MSDQKVVDNKIITRRPNGTKSVKTVNLDPSRARQEFKDEVNINNIISKQS